MSRLRTTIISIGMIFISGCSTTNAVNLPTISVTEFNQKLDKLVCDKKLVETSNLDENTCKEYYTTNKNSQFNRMLRAGMLLEVAARFGAARIEDYSGGETVANASRLLISLREARSNLKKLKENHDSARYYIDRTDLAISMLRVVNDATVPLREEFKKSVLLTPIQLLGKADDVLKNLFEDALYAHAYATTLFISVSQPTDVPNKQTAIWDETEKSITLQCSRIAKLAQVADSDIPAYCSDATTK